MLKLSKKEFNELPQDVQNRINAISFELVEADEERKQWNVNKDGEHLNDIQVEKEFGQSYYVLWLHGRCQGGFNTLLAVAKYIQEKI